MTEHKWERVETPAWAGDRAICDTCLRPVARQADEDTFDRVVEGEIPMPDGWGDNDAENLCWREAVGGECEPPEWFEYVTPADHAAAIAEIDRLRGERECVGCQHYMNRWLHLDGSAGRGPCTTCTRNPYRKDNFAKEGQLNENRRSNPSGHDNRGGSSGDPVDCCACGGSGFVVDVETLTRPGQARMIRCERCRPRKEADHG